MRFPVLLLTLIAAAAACDDGGSATPPDVDMTSVGDQDVAPSDMAVPDLGMTADMTFASDMAPAVDMAISADMDFAPDMELAADMAVVPDMELAADMALPAPDMGAPVAVPLPVAVRSVWVDRGSFARLKVRLDGEIVSEVRVRASGGPSLPDGPPRVPLGAPITFELWARDADGPTTTIDVTLNPADDWMIVLSDDADGPRIIPVRNSPDAVAPDASRLIMVHAHPELGELTVYNHNPGNPQRLSGLLPFRGNSETEGALPYNRIGLDADGDALPEADFVLPAIERGTAMLVLLQASGWCAGVVPFDGPMTCRQYLAPRTGPQVEFFNALDAGPDTLLPPPAVASLWAWLPGHGAWPMLDVRHREWNAPFRTRRNGVDLQVFPGGRSGPDDMPIYSWPYHSRLAGRLVTVLLEPDLEFVAEGQQMRVSTTRMPGSSADAWTVIAMHGAAGDGAWWYSRPVGGEWSPMFADRDPAGWLPAQGGGLPASLPVGAPVEVGISRMAGAAPSHTFGALDVEGGRTSIWVLQRNGEALNLLIGDGPGVVESHPAIAVP